jgi:hypothetical protein
MWTMGLRSSEADYVAHGLNPTPQVRGHLLQISQAGFAPPARRSKTNSLDISRQTLSLYRHS